MSHRLEEVELGVQEHRLRFLPLHLVQVGPVPWWSSCLLRLVHALHAVAVLRPVESEFPERGTRRAPEYERDAYCPCVFDMLGIPRQWIGRLLLRICQECGCAPDLFGRGSGRNRDTQDSVLLT